MKKLLYVFIFIPLVFISQEPIPPSILNNDNNRYSNDRVATSFNDMIYSEEYKKISDKKKINKDVLIVLRNDGKITAFDLETKKENWTFEFSDGTYNKMRNRFRIDEDVLYAVSTQRQLVALDLNDGSLFWKSEIGKEKSGKRYIINGQFLPIRKDLIFFASNNQQLYSFNKHTGKFVWNYRLEFPYNIYSPMVYGDRLIIPNAPWIYCFEASTGRAIWQRGFGNEPMYSLVQVDDKRTYIFGERSTVNALNLDNNANIDWQYEMENGQCMAGENTLLINGVLYFAVVKGKDKAPSVYALKPENGELSWKTTIDSGNEIRFFYKIKDFIIGFSDSDTDFFFMIDTRKGKKLKVDSPKDLPLSNIVQYDDENIAFLSAHHLVLFNIKTHKFKYEEIKFEDKGEDNFLLYFEIVRNK